MFGDKEKEGDRGKVETILGEGTKIKGDISTKGSLRIEGKVSGKIKAEGDLFVGESGKIKSEIKARKVIIAGDVEGNVDTTKLELLSKGKLNGDISTDTLKIEEGAVFIGTSNLKEKQNSKSDAKNNNKKSNVSKDDNKNKNNKAENN